MVSVPVVVAVCVTLAVTLLLPLVIYLIYGVKNKGKGVWTAWLIGAAGFFVPQVVVRLPVLNLLSSSENFRSFAAENFVLYVFALAFTAALFETAGRYAAAKLMGGSLTYEKGVAAGLGHGGIESMVIVGMAYVNNLILVILINTGGFDVLAGSDGGSLELAKAFLTSSKVSSFYLAGYERILTMVFHLALSLLMCCCVMRKKDFIGIGLCLVFHWGVDFTVPLLGRLASVSSVSSEMTQVLAYVFLTAVSAVSAVGIRHLRKLWRREAGGARCAAGDV